MYFATLIFALIAVFAVSEASKGGDNFIRQRAECQIENQLSDDSLAKAILNLPVEDPKIEQTGICILKKLGSMNANGELQIDDIRIAAKEAFGSKADKVVEECAVTKTTPGKTAMNLIRCWIKHVSQ